MDKSQFLALVQKYLDGKASIKEEEELFKIYDALQVSFAWPEELDPKELVKLRIYNKIKSGISEDNTKSQISSRKVLRYASAAAIIIAAIFTYKIYGPANTDALIDTIVNVDPNAITLTLDNGDIKVITEDGENKIYDSEGNEIGTKEKRQLDYSNATVSEKTAYNELNVPYGKRFDLILSDGTKVKLNAGTWLRYPVNFAQGEQRKVFFTGEAYFDVTKDTERPFIVSMENLSVEVLGTEFNMSYFPEDETINTVLVEGLVSIYENDKETDSEAKTLLEPGHLAAWDNELRTLKVSKVDTSIYTAWKEGLLLFKNVSFREICKKLERYMNVQIINEYDFLDKERFTASFDEEETIENILEYFNEDTPFEYSIVNNQITIKPLTPMN